MCGLDIKYNRLRCGLGQGQHLSFLAAGKLSVYEGSGICIGIKPGNFSAVR